MSDFQLLLLTFVFRWYIFCFDIKRLILSFKSFCEDINTLSKSILSFVYRWHELVLAIKFKVYHCFPIVSSNVLVYYLVRTISLSRRINISCMKFKSRTRAFFTTSLLTHLYVIVAILLTRRKQFFDRITSIRVDVWARKLV